MTVRVIKKCLIYHVCLCFTFLSAQTIDLNILKSLNKNDKPLWDQSMRVTSASLYPVMTVAFGGMLVDGYVKKDDLKIRNGYKSIIAVGFAGICTASLKYAVNRPRPKISYPDQITERDRAGKFSFPSGHTTSAFATATAISLSYKKWYVTAPSFLYAGFVGYSRMRLGMHYPSDVLAGMIIGIGSGLLTWQIDKMANGK